MIDHMKSLTEFVREALEVEPSRFNDMKVVTLLSREVKCKDLDEGTFVKYMIEDLEKAREEYRKAALPTELGNFEKRKQRAIEDATKFAETHYKRESSRAKYIASIEANFNSEDFKKAWRNDIFFDFDPSLGGTSGIPSVCVLNSKSGEDQLKKCFAELKKGKWFDKALGWKFKYESNVRDGKLTYLYSFRPYVDMILNESDSAEAQRDRQRLADDIDRFYAGSNYWGD